jgi:uncharacterized protein YbcI
MGLSSYEEHSALRELPFLPLDRAASSGRGEIEGAVHEAPETDGAAVAPPSSDGDVHASKLAEISRAMVSLYKEQFGRGPVAARSEWAGNDMLVCRLEGSLTQAEQNMRALGEHQRLRDIRMFFQYATVKGFVEPVERITGRTVRSFISGIDTEEDVSVEVFVFHPPGSDAPSRAEKSSV